MKKRRRAILIAGALAVGGFVFLTWYEIEYSMDVATELEVTTRRRSSVGC